MSRHDDLAAWPRMTRAEALRDQAPDAGPREPVDARCGEHRLINADRGRCGHDRCRACAAVKDGDLVRCSCGWDDGGDLAIYDTPAFGLVVSGCEGRIRSFCEACDEPLSALTVEVVA